MHLSEVCIRHPGLTTVMTLALLLFGLIGYSQLGMDLFPRCWANTPMRSSIDGWDTARRRSNPSGIEGSSKLLRGYLASSPAEPTFVQLSKALGEKIDEALKIL